MLTWLLKPNSALFLTNFFPIFPLFLNRNKMELFCKFVWFICVPFYSVSFTFYFGWQNFPGKTIWISILKILRKAPSTYKQDYKENQFFWGNFAWNHFCSKVSLELLKCFLFDYLHFQCCSVGSFCSSFLNQIWLNNLETWNFPCQFRKRLMYETQKRFSDSVSKNYFNFEESKSSIDKFIDLILNLINLVRFFAQLLLKIWFGWNSTLFSLLTRVSCYKIYQSIVNI